MSLSKGEYRELRRAAMRAYKAVAKSLKEEPSVVIIEGDGRPISDNAVNEITQWLFHRRPENDNTGN